MTGEDDLNEVEVRRRHRCDRGGSSRRSQPTRASRARRSQAPRGRCLHRGYTGVWTAIEFAERDPALKLVLLERDVCGTGASGRNGGFVTARDASFRSVPPGARLFLAEASEAAVVDIGGFCEADGIDAHHRSGGYLWTFAKTPSPRSAAARLRTRPPGRTPGLSC